MSIFGGFLSVSAIPFLMLCVLLIAAVGYILGRITIKGISLGTAGVFIIALLFGCFFYPNIEAQTSGYTTNALKIVENMGLILFVTSVGFIAGPKFFGNLKKNFKSYVLLGFVIIASGAIAAISCIFIGRAVGGVENDELTAMVSGLLAGALTSTPAFSAAKATVAAELEPIVAVGYGIAYIFGVVGVVLFIQLIPKLLRANMDEERAKLVQAETASAKKNASPSNLIHMDDFGFMPFAAAAVLGILLGSVKIPLTSAGLSGTTFSLTTTGGCLLVSLVFGHFGRIGKISILPDTKALKVFRELGLMLFLIGAGIAGGASFIKYFKVIYFLYGVWMTVLPMVIGYFFARYVLKLSLLNNLGSITGGMTSTPALGTLINSAKTEDVASAYAATYPIALIAVVLASQLIIVLF